MHPIVERAIEAAVESDVIVVAAAGQTLADFNVVNILSPEDSVVEPASYRDVIAVAGSTHNRRPWSASHSGANADITAPARNVWGADFHEHTGVEVVRAGSGTSFSAALTAGAAALWVTYWGRQHLRRAYPNTKLAWVFRDVLRRTADHAQGRAHRLGGDWDTARYGAGILNVEQLLREPLPVAATIPPPPAESRNLINDLTNAGNLLYDGVLLLQDLAQQGAEAAEDIAEAGLYATKAALDAAQGWGEEVLGEISLLVTATSGELQAEAVRVAKEAEDALKEIAEAAEEVVGEIAEAADEATEAVVNAVEVAADTAGEAAQDVVDFFASLFD